MATKATNRDAVIRQCLRPLRGAATDDQYQDAYARIDAGLSAASGEASGDDCCENGKFGDGHTCMKQPAPSEAPNTDQIPSYANLLAMVAQLRARIAELEKTVADMMVANEAMAKERDLAKHHWKRAQAAYDALAQERDSARAEGIAAEKKRCADIAEWFEDHEDDPAVARCAGLIAEIITREAKP